jgi:outer membrane protein OmpA-like peptidoglycan-associated protein
LAGAVASIGLDLKLGHTFKGVAQSYLPWTANDVRGPVRMFRAAADAGMGLVSAQMGFMHVLGGGTLNPLEVFFQDANLGVPDPAKVAEEGIKDKGAVTPKDLIKPDLTVSALFGSIGEPFWMVRKLPVIDASTPVVVQKADIDVTGWQQLHFCFDSAILTSAARQSLRQMCADYLPVFLNPQTQLVVVGHADSVGTAGYNLRFRVTGPKTPCRRFAAFSETSSRSSTWRSRRVSWWPGWAERISSPIPDSGESTSSSTVI